MILWYSILRKEKPYLFGFALLSVISATFLALEIERFLNACTLVVIAWKTLVKTIKK